MTHSMTAFARQEQHTPMGTLILELRSVNHRYLDIAMRLSEEMRMFEPLLREVIQARLARGKVDCNLRIQHQASSPETLEIDSQLVETLAHATREIDAILYNPAPINAMEVLRWPGVIKSQEMDADQFKQDLQGYIDAALDELIENRAREGGRLAELILARCDDMKTIVAQVQERLPQILNANEQRLRERLQSIKQDVDEVRLEQELVMFAQKVDVAEEMDRLLTHIEEVKRTLKQKKPVGRRLDFLMQELNREANTLGSKSVDSDTTTASVELKVLIEQMREQVQNIE